MSMSEEEALKNYDQFLRWFGWGAFAILATLPVFLYLTLYVLPYLIFGSLVVVAVFAVGFGRSAGQWEHAKFGAWLNATRLSILPVIVLMDSGALIAWIGINSVLALSGLRLPLPSWETVLLSVLFVADLPLLSWLQRAQQRRRRNVEVRYVRGDRAEVIRAFRARLESRGSAFRYEDKGRALKPYIAPTFFLAGDSLVLLVLQSRPRQVYLIRRRGPEVPEKTTAEIDTILEEALASSG